MKDFSGKTAFVTGGASGIGLALCHAFGQRGMNVAFCDVEAGACAAAAEALRGIDPKDDGHRGTSAGAVTAAPAIDVPIHNLIVMR